MSAPETIWSGITVQAADFDGCLVYNGIEDGQAFYSMAEGTSTLMRLSPASENPQGPPDTGSYLLSRRDGSQWLVLLVIYGETGEEFVAQVGTELETAAWSFTDGIRCTTFEDGVQECNAVKQSNSSGDFALNRGGEADLSFQRVTE